MSYASQRLNRFLKFFWMWLGIQFHTWWNDTNRCLTWYVDFVRQGKYWIECIPVYFRSIYRSLSSFRPEQELRFALEDGFAEQEAGARLRPGERKMQWCRSRPARLKLKHKQMSDTIEGENRSGAWPHLPKACYHDQGFRSTNYSN